MIADVPQAVCEGLEQAPDRVVPRGGRSCGSLGGPSVALGQIPPGRGAARALLALQRTAGNRATTAAIARATTGHRSPSSAFEPEVPLGAAVSEPPGQPRAAPAASAARTPRRLATRRLQRFPVWDPAPSWARKDPSQPGEDALGRHRADAAHAHVGDRVAVMLGDGTRSHATVVAVYTRALAFGDALLAPELAAGHQTNPLLGTILIRAGRSAAVARRRHALAARYPGLQVSDHASLTTAADADRSHGAAAAQPRADGQPPPLRAGRAARGDSRGFGAAGAAGPGTANAASATLAARRGDRRGRVDQGGRESRRRGGPRAAPGPRARPDRGRRSASEP